MTTPQRRWAIRKKKQNKCSRCGKPRTHYKQLCNSCQDKATVYMREYRRKRKQSKETA